MTQTTVRATAVAAALALAAPAVSAAEGDPALVVATYADIARAMYEDSLAAAQELHAAVDAFLAAPSEDAHAAAKTAWLAARVPYQQTEVYRFGNAIVDDWEGRVNSWPLDEGLIDYVDTAHYGTESPENAYYTANIVANPELTVGAQTVDAKTIDAALLSDLQEADEVEANVSRGYHAIEFLLWGQDLNGTGAGAGARPWTDFSLEQCTHENCDRRREYLGAATDLLVTDLEDMVANWQVGGEARTGLLVERPAQQGLSAMLTGLGSLSYGELAGERMQLGLLLHDPEEEHDCFADNTHNSHYYDQVGMVAVVEGRYRRVDGSVVAGPSLLGLLEAKDPQVTEQLASSMAATSEAMTAMKTRAEAVEAYDQMIGPDNPEGNAVVQAVIDRLKEQTLAIEAAVAALDLAPVAIEGSESLDDPQAVFFQ